MMENFASYMFLLKKFIGGLLMPLPLTLLLLVWAVLFLLRARTRWLGAPLALLATALLFVASYPPTSARIVAPLEQHYAGYQPAAEAAEFVAVLGSGHVSAAELPITSELSPTAIVRVSEGIRVYRLNPGSKLIFTGYHAGQPDSYAEKARQLAIALGVPEDDILAFTGPKDTAEEAALIAGNYAGRRLVLVTSALHMPRAMELFRQAGLEPTPAPTGHLAKPVLSKWLFPDSKSLFRTQAWAHERLGLLWHKLTKHAKTQKPAEQN